MNWPKPSFQVPVDRVFDVQWDTYAPGLEVVCSGLRHVHCDSHDRAEGGHYRFFAAGDGEVSFWRVLPSGQMSEIFRKVRWVAVGRDALLLEGDGVYGTLIKGAHFPASFDDTNLDLGQCSIGNSSEAFHWLQSQARLPINVCHDS